MIREPVTPDEFADQAINAVLRALEDKGYVIIKREDVENLTSSLKMTSMVLHGCDHHRGQFEDCQVGLCEKAREALNR
jgi:hypothetical protein